MSYYRATLSHAHPLKKVDDVLPLIQEHPIGVAENEDVDEVMKVSKVRHGELGEEEVPDDVL